MKNMRTGPNTTRVHQKPLPLHLHQRAHDLLGPQSNGSLLGLAWNVLGHVHFGHGLHLCYCHARQVALICYKSRDEQRRGRANAYDNVYFVLWAGLHKRCSDDI